MGIRVQTPDNPIGKYILERIKTSGLRRSQVARKMGFTNITKCLKKLDATIDTGRADKDFLSKIMLGLDITIPQINEQIKLMNLYLNKKEQEAIEEERRNFRPYLMSFCDRIIPSPIFAGLMVLPLRIRYYDKECLELPYIDLLAFIGSQIKEHYEIREHGVPTFGAIIGYCFRRGFDDTRKDILFFNTDGTLTEDRFKEHFQLGAGSLTLKNGKDILPLFQCREEDTCF